MFSSPYALTRASREVFKLLYRQGRQGFHTFCEAMEARRNTEALLALAARDDGRPGYLVYAPPYTSNSAGIWCLYRLCHELNEQGFPSFIVNSYCTARHWNAPLIGWTEARHLAQVGYTAVYPETIVGNPLQARSVARWVLNRPGLLGGNEVYDDSELVFNYSDVFKPYIKNRLVGKLYMPTIDESIFYSHDEPVPRTLDCFYVGKSTWKDGYVDRRKAVEITRRSPAKREELGHLFRTARTLYCFDNSTILVYEALMCGCPVVIIPDGTQTRSDLALVEMGTDGIAWGPEELPQVKISVAKVRDRYEQVKRDYAVQLARFIAVTQRKAA